MKKLKECCNEATFLGVPPVAEVFLSVISKRASCDDNQACSKLMRNIAMILPIQDRSDGVAIPDHKPLESWVDVFFSLAKVSIFPTFGRGWDLLTPVPSLDCAKVKLANTSSRYDLKV